MDEIYKAQLTHWKKVIEQCNARPQGQTLTDWLRSQRISSTTYYKWQRRVLHENMPQTDPPMEPAAGSQHEEIVFAEIPVSSQSGGADRNNSFQPDAVIQSGGITIGLSNSASKALITSILEAAGNVS